MGEYFKLRLPRIDWFLESILEKGRNGLVFKKDLRRAYRPFPIDQKDYDLLGFRYQSKFYFDTRCPFGLRSSAMICQRTTKAAVHIFTEQGLLADVYLDDFYGTEYPSLAISAFSQLGQLFHQLGLDSAPDKDSPPSTSMICLYDLSRDFRWYSRLDSRGSYYTSYGFTSRIKNLASCSVFHKETASVSSWEALLRHRVC